MTHEKKVKGDLAAVKVIADLSEKGYDIFVPVVCEHLPFDLIAYKDGKSFRIQVKYSSSNTIKNKTSWSDKNGSHEKKYNILDFDYYGVYFPDIKTIVYPNITFGGIKIATKIPNSATPFYWYEDFLDFTDTAGKKTYKDFGFELTGHRGPRLSARKVERPSKEELQKLLWEKPTTLVAKDFGVSDKAIAKWAKSYGLSKPPRGYWKKKVI